MGVDGVIELLNCGQGDKNYFATIEKLVDINSVNFREKVEDLLRKYLSE